MDHTQTNVKFKLTELVPSTDPTLHGTSGLVDVVTGIEGHYLTIVNRNETQKIGPNPQLLKSANWKVHVKAPIFYDRVAQSYSDDLGLHLVPGIFLSITHKRHPVTNMWVDLPKAKQLQYEITFIHEGDGNGDLTLYLKSKDAA